MTEQPIPPGAEAQPEDAVIPVTPRRGSELDQLHALYWSLKADRDEIEKQFKAVCDKIKVSVTQTDPNARRFEVTPSKGSENRPVKVTYTESQRIDSARLRKEHPELYAQYLKTSVSWSIRPSGGEG